MGHEYRCSTGDNRVQVLFFVVFIVPIVILPLCQHVLIRDDVKFTTLGYKLSLTGEMHSKL